MLKITGYVTVYYNNQNYKLSLEDFEIEIIDNQTRPKGTASTYEGNYYDSKNDFEVTISIEEYPINVKNEVNVLIDGGSLVNVNIDTEVI